MDIHKPKAWRGLRGFLKEYAIIVVGVLTALGAEQTVQWLHWRHEVADFRSAVRQELTFDLGTYQYRMEENGCVKARLDELERWLDSWRAGRPLALTGPIGIPASLSLENAVWQSRDANIVSHMASEERIALSGLYDRFQNNETPRLDERQAWLELAEFDGATALDQAKMMQLRGLITRARYRDSHITSNAIGYFKIAKAMGVSPRIQADVLAPDPQFCRSILVGRTKKRR